MAFIITDPCIETKDTACVDVCPVDCIHPRKDEAEYAQMSMLFIHPDECIDCVACVPASRRWSTCSTCRSRRPTCRRSRPPAWKCARSSCARASGRR